MARCKLIPLAVLLVLHSTFPDVGGSNIFLSGEYKNSIDSHPFESSVSKNIFLEHAVFSREASPFTAPTYLPPKEYIKCGGGQQCVKKNVCSGGYFTNNPSGYIQNCDSETDVCCIYRPPPTTTTQRPYVSCGIESDCVAPSQCSRGTIIASNHAKKSSSVNSCYAPDVCCRLPATTLTPNGYVLTVPQIPFPQPPKLPAYQTPVPKAPQTYIPPAPQPPKYQPPATQPPRYQPPAPPAPQPPKYQPPVPQTPHYQPPAPQPPRYQPPAPITPQTYIPPAAPAPQPPRYQPPAPQPPKYQPPAPQTPQYQPPAPQPPKYQPPAPQIPQYKPPAPQPPRYQPPAPKTPQTYIPPAAPAPQPPKYQPPAPQTPQYQPPAPQPPKYQPPAPQTPQYQPPAPQPPRYQPPVTKIPQTYIPPAAAVPAPRPTSEYLPPRQPPKSINPIGSSSNQIPIRGEAQLSEPIYPSRKPQVFENNLSPSAPQTCAAALICTDVNYCDAKGLISSAPTNLSPQQAAFRVPLSDCSIESTGGPGKCCRDGNYVDPWPVNPSGQCAARNRNTKPRGVTDQDTSFAEIPWQAMVLKESFKTLLCGGAIIGYAMVMTTASCLQGQNIKDVVVKGGEWQLGVDDEPLPFQLIRATEFEVHPGYNPSTGENNLAVILLEKNFQTAVHISPICISDQDPSPSEKCIVTGWGKDALRIHQQGALMHQTPASALSRSECGASPKQVCARTTYDACSVDYGSALACGAGDTYKLKGIFTSEDQCGNSVATFVKPDIKWINTAFNTNSRALLLG